MDLKDVNNKDELQNRIKDLFKEYEQMLLDMTGDTTAYKKSALIYYWMRDYKNYLKNESKFSSNYLPAFKRGNIVNVNLGFNLGSEMGGLHYAIVLQNSPRNNPNLVIAPLTSSKGRTTFHKSEVNLGEELYFKIQGKHSGLQTSIPNEIKLLEEAKQHTGQNQKQLEQRLRELEKHKALMRKTMQKLQVLKHGSIVAMAQIRTISKMRIADPVNQYDILYGLKLSPKSLDLIDEKIKELYIK